MGDPDRRSTQGYFCVVLNANRLPLAFISLRKGLKLVLKGKAEVLEHATIWRSERHEHTVPSTLVLKDFKTTGSRYHGPAPFNQRNLFQRDKSTCQYCRRHVLDFKLNESLTRDHVVPQSKGGKDDWTNCITACSTCNHRKDNRALSDIKVQVTELEVALEDAEKRNDKSAILRLTKELAAFRPLTAPIKAYVPTVFEILLNRRVAAYERHQRARSKAA